MIVEYTRYKIPSADTSHFEHDYAEAASGLDASPHCLAYELSQCTDEEGCYILRIEWDSAQGHLQGFRVSAEFRTFFTAIKRYVGMIQEMRHYEVTAVRGTKS